MHLATRASPKGCLRQKSKRHFHLTAHGQKWKSNQDFLDFMGSENAKIPTVRSLADICFLHLSVCVSVSLVLSILHIPLSAM